MKCFKCFYKSYIFVIVSLLCTFFWGEEHNLHFHANAGNFSSTLTLSSYLNIYCDTLSTRVVSKEFYMHCTFESTFWNFKYTCAYQIHSHSVRFSAFPYTHKCLKFCTLYTFIHIIILWHVKWEFKIFAVTNVCLCIELEWAKRKQKQNKLFARKMSMNAWALLWVYSVNAFDS